MHTLAKFASEEESSESNALLTRSSLEFDIITAEQSASVQSCHFNFIS